MRTSVDRRTVAAGRTGVFLAVSPRPADPVDGAPRQAAAGGRYQLGFGSLSTNAASRAFRCDALSDRERIDYLYAWALVGRDVDRPAGYCNAFGAPPRCA